MLISGFIFVAERRLKNLKTKQMKHLTKSEVAPELKSGDLIEYRDYRGFRQILIVLQTTDKFIHQVLGSPITYNELKSYMSNPDFKITSN